MSLVDGFTLPFKLEVVAGTCTGQDRHGQAQEASGNCNCDCVRIHRPRLSRTWTVVASLLTSAPSTTTWGRGQRTCRHRSLHADASCEPFRSRPSLHWCAGDQPQNPQTRRSGALHAGRSGGSCSVSASPRLLCSLLEAHRHQVEQCAGGSTSVLRFNRWCFFRPC